MVSLITRALLEALTARSAAPGKVPFRSSSINDPHIRDIVNAASAATGVPANLIDTKLKADITKIEQMKQYSYLLYDTAAKNAASNAAFDLIEHSRQATSAKFDPEIFMQLIQMVQLENEQFFPLRAPGEINYVFDISPILVPSNKKAFQKFNGIDTAAATAQGDFIFNKEFMQKLMDWASVEKLKPQGLKYESNGGPIPDNYAYIEFLIMHELLHYSYGDFTHMKRLPQYSQKEHNYATDFRSNYLLVKSGFEQLPIGLFSDHINYDRQETYDQMVDLVHNELKKMPKPLQKAFQKIASMDQHPQSGQPGEPQSGEGQDDGKEGKGKSGEGKEDEAGEPKAGKPGDDTAEKTSEGDTPTADEVEKASQEIERKLGERKEIGSKEEADKKTSSKRDQDTARGERAGGGPGGRVSSDFRNIEDEIARYNPRNWRTILQQMIKGSLPKYQPSLARPSRRNVTGAVMIKTMGAAPIKPGLRKLEDPVTKVMLVFDSSGSMHEQIPRVLAEARGICQQLGKNTTIGVCFFSGSARYFILNFGKDTWAEVKDAAEILNPPSNVKIKQGWKNLLGQAITGGTVFDSSIRQNLGQLADQDFNIMLFSDHDIVDEGNNWPNFTAFFKDYANHFFFVATTKEVLLKVTNKLNQRPKNFTYLS